MHDLVKRSFSIALCNLAACGSPRASTVSDDVSASARSRTPVEPSARALARRLAPRSESASADTAQVARSGDQEALAIARAKVLEYYAWIKSSEWATAETKRLQASNEIHGRALPSSQLRMQLEEWRSKHLRRARHLLRQLGDSRVVEDALADAWDEYLPDSARHLAVDFLLKEVAELPDERRASLRELDTSLSPLENSSIADVSQVVASLRQPFRDCYNAALASGVATGFQYVVTMEVDSEGSVSQVAARLKHSETTEIEMLSECVRNVAHSAQFARPADGSAVVTVPVTFVVPASPADRSP